jgi:hypothetical protein
MEQGYYLIDTNSVIDYLGKKLPEKGMKFLNNIIDDVPNLSIITQIEVLSFTTSRENYEILLSFVNDVTIFNLTKEIVDITVGIRMKFKTKLPDAIIAATSLAYNLTLISRNTADFKNIEGLNVINPHII